MYFVFSSSTSWADVEQMPVGCYSTQEEAEAAAAASAELTVYSMEEASLVASSSQAIADEMSALMKKFYGTITIIA